MAKVTLVAEKRNLKNISANIKGSDCCAISGKQIEIEVPFEDGTVGVITLFCITHGVLEIIDGKGCNKFVFA